MQSVGMQFFINGAAFASFIPRLPEIRDRLSISTGVLGALLTTAGVAGVLGSLVAARCVSRFGTRRTLIVGATVLIAMLPVVGFARSPVVFVLALAVMATVDVLVDVSMNLQASWLSARRQTPILNRVHGLWSIGTVVGGVVASRVAAAGVSLSTQLLVVTPVLGAGLVFVGRGLLRTDAYGRDHASAPAVDSTGMNTGRSLHTSLLAIAVVAGCALAVEVISADWAAFRLRDDFGTTLGFAGLGYVAFTGGMTTGRLAGDWVLVRLGTTLLGRTAIVATAVGLAGAAFLPNRFAVLGAYLVAGLGISTFFPRLYDEAARRPGKPGAGLGALTAGQRLTALAMPVVVGSLAAGPLTVGAATAVVVLPAIVGYGLLAWHRSPHAIPRRTPARAG